MNISLCRGCGRKIVFAKTEEGKTIPLDMTAPVYRLAELTPQEGGKLVAIRRPECHVSHFSTCKVPEKFSTPKKTKDKTSGTNLPFEEMQT